MDLPEQIGVMILPGVTLFPQAMLPLFIFEPRYRQMLGDALESHRLYCVAMRRRGSSRETPELVAGVGVIRASVGHPNGTSHLVLQGVTRVKLGRAMRYKPYRMHQIDPLPTVAVAGETLDRRLRQVKELVARRLELGLALPSPAKSGGKKDLLVKSKEILRYLEALTDPEQVADMVACSLLQDANHRQQILETADLEMRLRHLATCLDREIEGMQGNSAAC